MWSGYSLLKICQGNLMVIFLISFVLAVAAFSFRFFHMIGG